MFLYLVTISVIVFIVSSVHTGSTHGIPGGAGVPRAALCRRQRRPARVPTTTVLDRSCHGTMFETLLQTMDPLTISIYASPHKRRLSLLSDVGTVLHERTLNFFKNGSMFCSLKIVH